MFSKKVVHCCSAEMDAVQVMTFEMNMMVKMMDYLSAASLVEMTADVMAKKMDCL